jgi:hypothetical protein
MSSTTPFEAHAKADISGGGLHPDDISLHLGAVDIQTFSHEDAGGSEPQVQAPMLVIDVGSGVAG